MKIARIVAQLEAAPSEQYYDPVTNPTRGSTSKYLVYEDRVDNGKKQTRAFMEDPFDEEDEAVKAMNGLANKYKNKGYTLQGSEDEIDGLPKEVFVKSEDDNSIIKFYVKLSDNYDKYSYYSKQGYRAEHDDKPVTLKELQKMYGKDNVKILGSSNPDGTATVTLKNIKVQ